MKTFDEYWTALAAKNPAMQGAEKLRITVDSFKAQLRAAFEMGQKSEMSQKPNENPSLADQLFDRLNKKK